MKRRIRTVVFVAILTVCMLAETVLAVASTIPYDTYNYDYWDDIVYTPAAYIPEKNVSGASLGIGNFSTPQDLYVASDGVYVADTGNARVIKLNLQMTEVLEEITTFTYNGEETKFGSPTGLCVSDDNNLYVADRALKRVWVLSPDRDVIQVIENPQSEILDDNFDFTPLKVSVDYANRAYVVAAGKTQGILVFDADGNFTSFFGTINVKITAWERFWRRFSTAAQRAKQVLFIATEFTGLDVDPDGFVYTTNYDSDGIRAVMRLNPRGEDVIRKGERGSIAGDVSFSTLSGSNQYSGPSRIVDVVYRGKGIYSILDSTRGRIFTYDSEGNILYIFGGVGSQEGTFALPVAIEAIEDKIVVLDSSRQEIMLFKPTEYGSLIDEAIGLRYDGDEVLAVDIWKKVLQLDENNELANDGIGKAYLTSGNNEEAMKYLRLANDRKYYSVAFRRYRNEFLSTNLQYILTAIIVIIIAIVVTVKIVQKKRGTYKEKEGLL